MASGTGAKPDRDVGIGVQYASQRLALAAGALSPVRQLQLLAVVEQRPFAPPRFVQDAHIVGQPPPGVCPQGCPYQPSTTCGSDSPSPPAGRVQSGGGWTLFSAFEQHPAPSGYPLMPLRQQVYKSQTSHHCGQHDVLGSVEMWLHYGATVAMAMWRLLRHHCHIAVGVSNRSWRDRDTGLPLPLRRFEPHHLVCGDPKHDNEQP